MTEIDSETSRPTWFVGAVFGRTNNHLPRFLAEGIWEVDRDDDYDTIVTMKPGDRIAAKATYTRKRDLPFDNRNNTVSVMEIRAVGTITANPKDGRRVYVDWSPMDPAREWYFYTGRQTIWRVLPTNWKNQALLEFTFEGKTQDIDRFRNAPLLAGAFWHRGRSGSLFLDPVL